MLRHMRSGHQLAAVGIACMLVAAIWIATAARIAMEQKETASVAMRANANLALALEESTVRLLDEVDGHLDDVASHPGEAAALLREHVARGVPGHPESVAVFDADGRRVFAAGAVAFELDPDQLRIHRDRAAGAAIVGRPFRTADGRTMLPISRRIDATDEDPRIVAAAVDTEAFAEFYGRTDFGESGVVTLVGLDGVTRVRRVGNHSTAGEDMKGSRLMQRQARSAAGTFVSTGRLEGTPRYHAYRTVPRYGLVVSVGTSVEEALAPVRQRGRFYQAAAAVATAFVAGMVGFFVAAIRNAQSLSSSLEHTRAELAGRDARMRAVLERLASGVITAAPDGRILAANQAAERMYGYAPGEMEGVSALELVTADRREAFAALIRDFAMHDGAVREGIARRKDGSTFTAEVVFSHAYADGQHLLTAIVTDTTERSAMQAALLESEGELRRITDAVPAFIAYIDADWRYRLVNKTFADWCGQRREDMIGRQVCEVAPPEVYAAIQPWMQRALAGEAVRFETRHAGADGQLRDMISDAFPRVDHRGRVEGFYLLVTDVTALKRTDRMKSEFVSTVSHELRTPLTSIRASLGLITGGVVGAADARVMSLVAIAMNNCERLIRLVNDILDTERLDADRVTFDIRPIDLVAAARHAIATHEPFAREHGVAMSLAGMAAEVPVLADPDRLQQAVTNLLSNAIKFSQRGGTVEIGVSVVDGGGRIEVRDHGPGIPLEFRDRIFQKFAQADASDAGRKGGTGLGLSIARALVERMGGRIGYESEPGAGATFFIELRGRGRGAGETRAAQASTERVTS